MNKPQPNTKPQPNKKSKDVSKPRPKTKLQPITKPRPITNRRLHILLSYPIYLLLYSYTAAIVLLILILAFLRWKWAVRQIMGFWALTIFPLIGKRVRIRGRQNLDRKKQYILLANHASMFDIMAIMTFYPGVAWFGHERLLRIPLFRQMLLMTDYVPMRMSSYSNTKEMLKGLEEKAGKRTVAIFPEGTRTLDGKMNSFYRGFIHLLRATEHDILPVTLNGFYKLKPKNRFSIHFGARLEVVIHPPMDGPGIAALKDGEIMDRVAEVLESANTDL